VSNANPMQATAQMSHWIGLRRKEFFSGVDEDKDSPTILHFAYSHVERQER
jgi:hypothetical protein